MRFMLNETLVESACIAPDTTVLNMLREQQHGLTLSGTKEGCASGDCGACTVMVGSKNDLGEITYKAINSCIALAGSLDGKHLVTVEGLASGKNIGGVKSEENVLYSVQQAMVEHHGSQCGFCTPGFVMSMATAVQAHSNGPAVVDPGSAREIVLDAISGNLCRCTGYKPIVDAGVAALLHAQQNSVCSAAVQTFLTEKASEQSPKQQDTADSSTPEDQYFRPTTLKQLDTLLASHGNKCLVAGGTDFGLEITQRWNRYPAIIDVNSIHELDEIDESGQALSIGAGVTYTQLEELFAHKSTQFVNLLHRLGSRQIRNSGTLGGNIGNASPIADTPPVLIAWDATLELRNSQGNSRIVSVESFYLDYRKTCLMDDEVIVRIIIPAENLARFHRIYKHSKRLEDDISSVLGAFSFDRNEGKLDSVRIAYGGMAAVPIRVVSVEDALNGRLLNAQLIREACTVLRQSLAPMSDVRASAEFRMDMAVEMLERALLESQGENLPRIDDLVISAGDLSD